jgi:hypothetical protein
MRSAALLWVCFSAVSALRARFTVSVNAGSLVVWPAVVGVGPLARMRSRGDWSINSTTPTSVNLTALSVATQGQVSPGVVSSFVPPQGVIVLMELSEYRLRFDPRILPSTATVQGVCQGARTVAVS